MMPNQLDPQQREALRAHSAGALSALDLRRRLGDVSYGEVLMLLSEAHLPLPQAPQQGPEEQLARARQWLFGEHEQR